MIYLDVSAAVHSRAGLGRYSQRLAESLIADDPSKYGLFYNRGQRGRLPAGLDRVPRRTVRWGYKPWRLAILAATVARINFNRLVPDAVLFHSTEHLLMPLSDCPTVLTVHDLIFKIYPKYHKKLNYLYLKMAMPIFCRRATAIIAVSNATKTDIVDNYGIDPDKIHVVYEAAADHFKPQSSDEIDRVRKKYSLPDRYLVHIGTIEPRKNLERMLDSLKIIKKSYPALSLVLAGGKGWLTQNFYAKIDSSGLSDSILLLDWVPDSDLPAVICGAELAVQPSLYEGFGLPILEHMASGQVVASSSSSSLPEVGGKAAAYFDPEDVDQMVAVISRLLDDGSEWAHRRELGLQQAKQFSWGRAAQETREIYNQLIQVR